MIRRLTGYSYRTKMPPEEMFALLAKSRKETRLIQLVWWILNATLGLITHSIWVRFWDAKKERSVSEPRFSLQECRRAIVAWTYAKFVTLKERGEAEANTLKEEASKVVNTTTLPWSVSERDCCLDLKGPEQRNLNA